MLALRQLLRYLVIGLGSNLVLYSLYLLITYLGMGHKMAMTLLYCLGVGLTFIFNRNWTFGHQGKIRRAFTAYVGIYAFGYVVNFAGLYFAVDKLGYRHEWVQGVLIILVALLLFLMQKYLVFSDKPSKQL